MGTLGFVGRSSLGTDCNAADPYRKMNTRERRRSVPKNDTKKGLLYKLDAGTKKEKEEGFLSFPS